MAEFEYNLLIIHDNREVIEDLLELFGGHAPETMEAPDMDYQAREYIGTLTLPVSHSEESTNGRRKLFIHIANSAQDYRMFWKDHFHHAVLLNLSLPEDQFSGTGRGTGMSLLKALKSDHPESEIIVFTDQMVANRAIEAVKNGAFYFVQQPQIYLEFVQALVVRIIQMMEGAYLDTLTGLHNRRFFQRALRNYFEELRSLKGEHGRLQGSELSLILIDLNDFKAVNDTYGHPEGDRVLQHASRLIEQSFRKTDVIGRIGGDEFAAIVPRTPHRKALDIAERLRQEAAGSGVEVHMAKEKKEIRCTISAGVATYPHPNQVPDVDAFVKAADQALYHAKSKLRKNAVCGYNDDGTIFPFTKAVQDQ